MSPATCKCGRVLYTIASTASYLRAVLAALPSPDARDVTREEQSRSFNAKRAGQLEAAADIAAAQLEGRCFPGDCVNRPHLRVLAGGAS